MKAWQALAVLLVLILVCFFLAVRNHDLYLVVVEGIMALIVAGLIPVAYLRELV